MLVDGAYAGLLATLLHEAPESLEMLLAAPSYDVLMFWSLIGIAGYPVQTSAAGVHLPQPQPLQKIHVQVGSGRADSTVTLLRHAGCLEVLIQAEHTGPRVLKHLEGAAWDVVAKALGHLVHHLCLPLGAVASKQLGYVLPCPESHDAAIWNSSSVKISLLMSCLCL